MQSAIGGLGLLQIASLICVTPQKNFHEGRVFTGIALCKLMARPQLKEFADEMEPTITKHGGAD